MFLLEIVSVNDILECLDRLVAFPTVSRDTNLPLVHFVTNYLNQLGFSVQLFHNQERSKAGLYCAIGPSQTDGVILSGHTDVVPVDGQDWSSDPFHLLRHGDRLFGRGAADMKGFLSCALTLAKAATTRNLRRPLHIVMSYDEEVGCRGVRPMLAQLVTIVPKPALVIIGEPTQMQVAVAHKGKLSGRVQCHGHSCHSSRALDGLNAIHLAADMIDLLRELQADIIDTGDSDKTFKVPFTTVHVGTIQGGTALNIVPANCTLEFEIRNIPSDDPQAIVDRLTARAAALSATCRRAFPESGIQVEVFNSYPGLQTQSEASMVTIAGRFGDGLARHQVDFGTEGGLFRQSFGVPVVICGPGNMDDAHKANEYVSLDQLRRCNLMLLRILTWLEH
jgi:acetylornithine deacetylase